MILGAWSYALTSTLLALAFPTYCSMKALRTSTKEDDVQWLTYWVVYAVFRTVEFAPDFLLSSWMPLYFELKLGFLFWLQSPTFQGATFLNKKYLEPWLNENEAKIDEKLALAKEQLKSLRSEDLAKYGAMAYKYVSSATKQVKEVAEVTKEKATEVAKQVESVAKATEETAETDKDK